MARIYLYARVSHRGSALSGLSEDVQFHAMRCYISSLLVNASLGKSSWPADMPSGLFVDRGVSGWSKQLDERPAGALLMNILQPGDHVVFYSVDRMCRSVMGFARDVDAMLKLGISPHFVRENLNLATASGRMIGNMLAVLAQYTSDMISERTREALALKRAGYQRGEKRERNTWASSGVFIPERTLIIPTPMTGRILRYIRCSHIDSEESGLGLEKQTQAVTNFAQRLMASRPGLVMGEQVYADLSTSAFHKELGEREAGRRMLDEARAGDQVVFYRCDRGFRMPHDAAVCAKDLASQGIGMHLADSGIDSMTDFGSLWITMLAVFAALESQIKSVRNKEVARELRASGRPVGPIPSHCRVTERRGVKKLTYDFQAIKWQAAAWSLKQLGHTEEQCSDVLHAHYSRKIRRKPRSFGSRKGVAWGRIKTQNGIKRFGELRLELPARAIQEAMCGAIEMLSESVDPQYLRVCSVPLPVPCIRDRLSAAGIV